MGATTFLISKAGATAKEAFDAAVDHALWEHGHGGYTGSIAEKRSFVMVEFKGDLNDRAALHNFADTLCMSHPKISDKYGPAGCIDLRNGKFLFFGWAAE